MRVDGLLQIGNERVIMVQAVIKDGRVELLDPLPAEWSAGTRLNVDRLAVDTIEDDLARGEFIDRWLADFESTLAQVDSADDAILAANLAEADVLAKAQVRREMGL